MSLAADAPLWIATTAYVVAAIGVPVWLRRRDTISSGMARKAVHLFAGLAVITVPYYRTPVLPVTLALAATALTLASRPDSPVRPLRGLYDAIAEPAERGPGYLQGPFHYCLAVTLVVAAFLLLLPRRLPLAVAAILLMIVADPLASFVGRRWGRRTLPIAWPRAPRTFVGSATFFLSGFLVCAGYLGLVAPSDPQPFMTSGVLGYSLAAALAGTVIEAVSPSNYDDLTVPLGAAGVLLLATL